MISAHGVGAIYELPVPLSWYLGGAAAAVLASFVVQVLIRGSRPSRTRRIAGTRAVDLIVSIASGLGLVWFISTLLMTVLEPSSGLTLAPLLFWVVLIIVGMLVSSVVAGLWERANPWTAIRNFVGVGDESALEGSLQPPWWLGPLLMYALFWFELVSGKGFEPLAILLVTLAYSGYVAFFRRRFGDYWRLADPLSILFGFASRTAPIEITEGEVTYRGPLRGMARDDPMPLALFASVFILLASTTLDNVRETLPWSEFMGTSGLVNINATLIDSVALVVFTLPFLVPFLGAIWVARRWTDRSFWQLARTFGWSLSPIGVAYILAHNLPLLFVGGPFIITRIIGEPGGLFDGYIPSARAVWFLEIAAIVGGHVLGVLGAHRIARFVTQRERDAVKSHIALTVLMSFFTIATLYLLSQPLVRR